MIRPARFADIPAMASIMEGRYRDSPYARLGEIDLRETKALLQTCIQRHNTRATPGEGATLALVATDGEDGDGQVERFIVGVLERVYQVGVPLTATDLWFTGRHGADPRSAFPLAAALVAWARANPRVVEIRMGVVDTFGTDIEKAGAMYRRLGLERCGEIYRGSIAR